MSVQRLPQQPADHLVPRPNPLAEPEVIDLADHGLRQSQVDLLVGFRICFDIHGNTYIFGNTGYGGTSIITDIDGIVNGGTSRQENFL